MVDFPQNPYRIHGIVQDTAANAVVIGVNLNTLKTESVFTADDGSYVIDAANMTSGYSDGDLIKVTSGAWSYTISIDIINSPSGILKNINRPANTKTIGRKRGLSIGKGISFGFRR